jgi:hypothetical protein
MEESRMDAIQNAELTAAPEQSTIDTTVGTCPTCISGTDPITKGLGPEILQDLD